MDLNLLAFLDVKMLVATAAATWMLVRAAKAVVPIAERWWTLVALALALVITFATAWPSTIAGALQLVVQGLAAALVATGGHEHLKLPLGGAAKTLLGESKAKKGT